MAAYQQIVQQLKDLSAWLMHHHHLHTTLNPLPLPTGLAHRSQVLCLCE